MDNAEIWHAFFANWPPGLPPRGVMVTSYNDQIQFVSFMATDTLLMVERQTPDSMGGRKVVIPFGNIVAVKVIDPIGTEPFTAAGFRAAPGRS